MVIRRICKIEYIVEYVKGKTSYNRHLYEIKRRIIKLFILLYSY